MGTKQMDENKFKVLNDEAVGYFRAKQYSEAMAKDIVLLALYEGMDSPEVPPKNHLICLGRILTSTYKIHGEKIAYNDKDLLEKEEGYYDRYMKVIQSVSKEEIAPNVVLSLFTDRLSFHLPWEEQDSEVLESVAVKFQDMLHEFLEKAKGQVSKRELCDRWMQVLEKVRRNVVRSGFHKMVFFLAESFLPLLEGSAEFAYLRSSVYNLLADTAYFFPEQNTTDQERFSLVQGYLEKSLESDPDSQFAKTMGNNIRRLETTSLQIRGFRHDTRSRIAKISRYLDHFKLLEGEAAEQNIAAIRAEVEVLQALADLHEISGNIEGALSYDNSVEEDIAPFIEQHISVLNESFSRAPIKRIGMPRKFRFWRGPMGVVLQNLVANTDEAYGRRKMALPEYPCEFIVDYEKSKVVYRDFAGGIQIAGDIFEPYVSEKGVFSDRGLGLPQAATAMRAQGYKLIFKAHNQPAGGAEFIMEFIAEV